MWPIVRFGLNFFATLGILAGLAILGMTVFVGLINALT